MRSNVLIWALVLPLLMLAGACCGSSKSGAKPLLPEIRYLPSPTAKPCLSNPPPTKPDLSCPSTMTGSDCEDIRTAKLLDHLDELDGWANLYAWPLCKEAR